MGALYLYTLQPSLAWGDGTRLQREVITGESFILTELVDVEFAHDPFPFARLGVAAWDHPLYVVAGHLLVSSLPAADPLWLVNLISAIFGAASLVVFFKLLFRHTKSLTASLFASLGLAVSHTFWWHAVTPEVYTLFAFLMLLAIYFFDTYLQTGKFAALAATALLVGLGAANHLLAFLLLPAAAIYLVQFCGITQYDIMFSRAAKLLKYFANDPAKDVADLRSEILVLDRVSRPRVDSPEGANPLRFDFIWYLLLLVVFMVGFSPYWIQLLRVLRTFPPAEVMGPALGATFLRGSLATSPTELAGSLASYLVFLFYQFGPVGVALGIYGWWQGRSHYVSLWRMAIVLYGVYLLFGIIYGVSDQFAFFLAAHVFWALAIGMGIARAEAALPQSKRWALSAGLILAILVMPLVYEVTPGLLRTAGLGEEAFGIPLIGTGVRDGLAYYLTPNKGGDNAASDFGRDALSAIPENAVIVAEWFTDTDEYFVLRYFTAVEGLRPDVEIIGWPLEDPFSFDPQLVIEEIETSIGERPVFLASLSDEFYAASTIVERYCVVPENGLYRVYLSHEAAERSCLARAA
jgi:hypothetical protein